MNKVFERAEEAIADLHDGATLMSGGFGLSGNPENLIRALRERGTRDLTVISNNCGTDACGLGILLHSGQIRKMISSYVGENKEFARQLLAGELEVELVPQGTLAERIRAAGAGIPAFFTPTGVGTVVADGKETREINGRTYLLEHALHADFALIRAQRADAFGNLRFWRTARNFSPVMATAARVTVAEVDHLLPNGAIDPDDVHLPGLYVQRLVEVTQHEDPFEYRTTRPRPDAGA